MSLVRSVVLVLFVLVVVGSQGGLAAAEVLTVLAEQSSVTFHGSSTLHDFDGTAKVVGGAFDLTAGAGMVETDATSMNTASAGRDEKMHGETMLSTTYPRIRFDLTRFETTASGGTAYGRWTMHGVTRELSIPLTFATFATIATIGTPAARHARATFELDIRRWSIPVPRVVIITVDPLIKVTIDLALKPDAAATVAAAPVRAIVGMVLPNAAGVACAVAAGRSLVVCDTDHYSEAKEWIAVLAKKLPADRLPLMVVMDDALAEGKRPKWTAKAPANALFDWSASLRQHLLLPTAPIQVVVVDTMNRVVGIVDGEAEDAERDAVLTLLEIPLK